MSEEQWPAEELGLLFYMFDLINGGRETRKLDGVCGCCKSSDEKFEVTYPRTVGMGSLSYDGARRLELATVERLLILPTQVARRLCFAYSSRMGLTWKVCSLHDAWPCIGWQALIILP